MKPWLSLLLAVVAVLISVFPNQILMIFAKDSRILDIGTSYLRVNAIGYLIFSISYVTNGIITGSGKPMVTMTISAVSLLLLRIPLADIMSQTYMGIMGIWYAILITYVFSATCSMFYYLSERYNENLIKYGEKAYN